MQRGYRQPTRALIKRGERYVEAVGQIRKTSCQSSRHGLGLAFERCKDVDRIKRMVDFFFLLS